MTTLPTESQILAADFSGDTLASLLKTAAAMMSAATTPSKRGFAPW